jgi:pimeloyl-ACP methyl ester carboxylesterase
MAQLAINDLGGRGPTLVLVHGYTGSSDDFMHVVEPLREHSRVVLIDQLGHGQSPRVAEYDLDVLTAALTIALETLDEPVDLLGHSMGGRTVLPIAINRPDLVRSLIMMDTWADDAERGDDGPFFDRVFELPMNEALAALDALWEEPGPEDALVIARWGADWLNRHHAYNSDHLDPLAKYELGKQIFLPMAGLLNESKSIGCPTTVICGEFDAPFIEASQRMADTIPGARLAMIPGAYHSPQLTHPELWAAVITEHLHRTG